MGAYNVYFKSSVEKDFKKIPKIDLRKILPRISLLADNHRPAGYEKLTGQERYRVKQGRFSTLQNIFLFFSKKIFS